MVSKQFAETDRYGAGVEKAGVRANDIVHRLNVKADMLTMGERIAWGSDSAIMREAAAEIEKLRGALSDLLSWFPDKPTEPEWRIKAGGHGADDAITEARATLTTGGTHD